LKPPQLSPHGDPAGGPQWPSTSAHAPKAPLAPPPNMRKVICNDVEKFKFANCRLTDVCVANQTITFLEL